MVYNNNFRSGLLILSKLNEIKKKSAFHIEWKIKWTKIELLCIHNKNRRIILKQDTKFSKRKTIFHYSWYMVCVCVCVRGRKKSNKSIVTNSDECARNISSNIKNRIFSCEIFILCICIGNIKMPIFMKNFFYIRLTFSCYCVGILLKCHCS